jgi:hypothetical protein
VPLTPAPARGRRQAASAAVLLASGAGVTGWALTTDPALPPPPAASSAPVLQTPRRVAELVASAASSAPAPAAASARPQPAPLVLPRSQPVRVRVPTLGVDSGLVALGLQPDGTLEVPARADLAGWYAGSPTPGELGPSVLAGHVDSVRGPGVFFRLRELAPGDRVVVDRADGTTATFEVERVEQHPKNAFPTQRVYGDIDHAGLRLITCGGTFDRSTGHYRSNVVVYARLAGPPAAPRTAS